MIKKALGIQSPAREMDFRAGERDGLAWTVPACVIWSAAYVSVAAAAAGTYRELADQLHYAGYLFVAVIVAFLLLAWLAKRLIFAREARHLSLDDHDAAPGHDVAPSPTEAAPPQPDVKD